MKIGLLALAIVSMALPGYAEEKKQSSVKERFWLKDPSEIGKVLTGHVALNPSRGEVKEIGKSFSGRPIYTVRYGSGPQIILYVNAHHGWETVTTNGANALIWTLFSGKGLDGEDRSTFVDEVAQKQTVWILPLVSPDIAVRQYERFPEGFFPNGVGMKTKEEREEYVHVMNDPFDPALVPDSKTGYTQEAIEKRRKEKKYFGQRWSDQGVDVWEDYEDFKSPEARVVRDFVLRLKPDCIMEFHGHEGPMFIGAATPFAKPDKAERQVKLATEMLSALIASGAKCAGIPASVYLHKGHNFPNWVDHQMPDTMFLFSELQMWDNAWYADDAYKKDDPVWGHAAGIGMPSQDEIIRAGWTVSMALLKIGNRESYRVR